MRKNYSAWDINYQEFYEQTNTSDKLKFLIKFAVLAPSTHNSQPWKFQIDGDAIVVKAHFNRKLPVSDPHNRHLYISLGAAIENLIIAADYYGFNTIIKYYSLEHRQEQVAKITFTARSNYSPPEEHLIFSIPERRSNRSPYADHMPPEKVLNTLRNLANDEVEIFLTNDRHTIEAISDALMEARVSLFNNKEFRGEMADYKKTNFTRSPFGMPGFVMGFGNLFSLIAPTMLRFVNPMIQVGQHETDLLKKYTPVQVFINTKQHNPRGWLEVGRILQRFMITAQHYGVQTAVSAVPLDVNPIKKIMNTNYRPEVFVRLGYATATYGHSPRLTATEVIE